VFSLQPCFNLPSAQRERRPCALPCRFNRPDAYDVREAIVRPRVFQESGVDMARQCGGHGARPAPLGVRWDLAGDARSRLPRVATVLPGGAADRAGLQAGDRLVGVTGGGRRLSLRKWAAAAAADRPPLERITERMGCRALPPPRKHRRAPARATPRGRRRGARRGRFPLVLHVRRGAARALLEVEVREPQDELFGAYTPQYGLTEKVRPAARCLAGVGGDFSVSPVTRRVQLVRED
jgi:hypothetical protein